MKKAKEKETDELRPEYKLDELGKGVRGKHLSAYRKGTNLVLLRPEIAKAFPTSEAVNKALHGLLELTEQTNKLTGRIVPRAVRATRPEKTNRLKSPRPGASGLQAHRWSSARQPPASLP